MARRTDLDDNYGSSLGGPLFEAAAKPGLPRFVGDATPSEVLVVSIIHRHQGRENPVSIARITEECGLTARVIKEAVRQLRKHHRFPIGARRDGERPGYFWIVDAADADMAWGPYYRQILDMAENFGQFNRSARNRELYGQLRIKLGVGGEES